MLMNHFSPPVTHYFFVFLYLNFRSVLFSLRTFNLQKENCRPDGRELSEFRTTTLNIGEEQGLFLIQCHNFFFHSLHGVFCHSFYYFFLSGSISTADGSALVKIGNTTIICGVKAVFNTTAVQKPCCNPLFNPFK